MVLFFGALPSSSNYQLRNYNVGGSGGQSSSANYTSETSSDISNSLSSGGGTFSLRAGSLQAQMATTPRAPTLSNNSGAWTDKMNVIITTSGNPTDAVFSIMFATTSNFASPSYVQADGTLGASPVYQTYTTWGGASGITVTGLSSTRYWVKCDAIHGKYTASPYGPSANLTLSSSQLTFSLTPSTIAMGSLLAGSVITSPSTIALTFMTTASNGGTIYVAGQSTGLVSTAAGSYNLTVTPPSGNLTSLSEGFGLQALTADSPLTLQSPYNGSSDTVGAIYTAFQPVFAASSAVSTTANATATLKAKASATTPAANDYQATLTFVAAASF